MLLAASLCLSLCSCGQFGTGREVEYAEDEFGDKTDEKIVVYSFKGISKRYSIISGEVTEGTYILVAQDATSTWIEVSANDGATYIYLFDSILDIIQEYDENASALTGAQFKGTSHIG